MSALDEEINPTVDLLGGPYAYRQRDIVVASQHAALVTGLLGEAGVTVDEVKASELLGLTLLQLEDVEAAAAAMVALVGEAEGRPEPDQPLDQVLWALRTLSGRRYAQWSPTIGKNRLVGQVQGVGRVNHSGGGDPIRATAPGWSTRATGPGRGTRVGVLDTGLYPQPWLAGGWAARYSDLTGAVDTALYADGHATFISGLILREAPGATVEVRRVLQSTGVAATNGSADSWSVAEAIVDFGRSGLDVLNLSFVCYTEDGNPPLVLSTAIDRLPPDLLVVAAAGNHGGVADPEGRPLRAGQATKPGWPAALDDVVAVGALEPDLATSASFSPDAPWIDVLAPGVDVTSTYLPRARPDESSPAVEFPDGWATWSGTSFAAATVSGVVAASTEPGRVSARSAAEDLLASLPETAQPALAWSGAKVLKLAQI
ncbi:S8 family serine peptidase [uncultured Friedmanniella sp.]|uniref:S8 family peptidase n=1 Tax=uncultured Friedmanniella sp. TaxID=335381 RepID=UPI0035CC21CC